MFSSGVCKHFSRRVSFTPSGNTAGQDICFCEPVSKRCSFHERSFTFFVFLCGNEFEEGEFFKQVNRPFLPDINLKEPEFYMEFIFGSFSKRKSFKIKALFVSYRSPPSFFGPKFRKRAIFNVKTFFVLGDQLVKAGHNFNSWAAFCYFHIPDIFHELFCSPEVKSFMLKGVQQLGKSWGTVTTRALLQ